MLLAYVAVILWVVAQFGGMWWLYSDGLYKRLHARHGGRGLARLVLLGRQGNDEIEQDDWHDIARIRARFITYWIAICFVPLLVVSYLAWYVLI